MLAMPRWSKSDIDKIRAQRIAHEKDLVERKQQANRTYSQAYAKNVDYDISELKQQRDIAKEQEKNRPQMARLNWEKAPYEGYSGEALRNALIKDAQARDPGFARLNWEKSDEHRQRNLEALGKQNEPQMARLGWEKSDQYGQRIMDQITAHNKPAQDKIDYEKSMLSHVRDLRLQDRRNKPAMAELDYYKQVMENQGAARAAQLAMLMGRGVTPSQGQNGQPTQNAPAYSSYTPPTTQFKSGGFFDQMSADTAGRLYKGFITDQLRNLTRKGPKNSTSYDTSPDYHDVFK